MTNAILHLSYSAVRPGTLYFATFPCLLSTAADCRDQYGVALLVKLLEAMPYSSVTLAAADAVRAVAMNNDGNKGAVRENWGIPLLVRMLSAEVHPASRFFCFPAGHETCTLSLAMICMCCPLRLMLTGIIQWVCICSALLHARAAHAESQHACSRKAAQWWRRPSTVCAF